MIDLEFFCFCIIASPGQPYGGCMRHFNRVEANMKLRLVTKELLLFKTFTKRASEARTYNISALLSDVAP